MKLKLFKYYKEIILFGFAYSCVIGFSLYGPLLDKIYSGNTFVYTMLGMIAFIIAFVHTFISKIKKSYVIGLIGISFIGIVLFYDKPSINAIFIFCYALGIATICRSFTLQAYKFIKTDESEWRMSIAFIIAFSILYMCNVIKPLIGRTSAMIILCILTLLTCVVYQNAVILEAEADIPVRLELKRKGELFLSLSSLYVVYIGGGISYAGMYPYLEVFAVDRFINVLPLILLLHVAGILGKKIGNTFILLIGIISLSIAFAFFLLPMSYMTYFVVQTTLQIGWAFVNVWGFSYSWRLAKRYAQPYAFGHGIIFILLGVLSGSVIASIITLSDLPAFYYGPVTFVPLVTGLVFQIVKRERQALYKEFEINDTKMDKHTEHFYKMSFEVFDGLPVLSELTKREREITFYYYHSESAVTIGKKLFISTNTVRTHIKNSYQKLNVTNRNALRQLLDENHQ